MTTILKVRGIDKLSASDLLAFVACADALGINPDWLACVVAFETDGSWSPAKQNIWATRDAEKRGLPYSGAIGLIQFMGSTAKSLGTTTAELAAMTFAEQLSFVRRYLSTYASRIKNLEDCYLAVFYPAAIGRTDDYVMGQRDAEGFIGRVYEQNAGFDTKGNNDGRVTRGEVCATIRAVRDAAGGKRIDVTDGSETVGDVDEAARINAEQVLASVYATATQMVGELVSRDMARSSEAPPDDKS